MSTAVERYSGGAAPEISDQEWDRLTRRSEQLARSNLVPVAFRKKPDDIMAVAITARDLGMSLTLTTLAQFFVVEGRVTPSAQLMIGMAAQHGHEVWVESSDSEQATVSVKRRDSERVQSFTFTLEMAKRAGLVGKDNWKKYQEVMLIYRAATRALRAVCPEVMLGLPQALIADELPENLDPDTGELVGGSREPAPADTIDDDDDVVDAEIVEDGDPGGDQPVPSEDGEEDGAREDPSLSSAVAGGGDSTADTPQPGEAAPAGDSLDAHRQRLRKRVADLGDQWKNAVAVEWRKQKCPPVDHEALTLEHVEKIDALIDVFADRKKDSELRRQKHVNAELNELGIKDAAARHAFIKAATNGETESSAGLTGPQTRAIQEAVDRRKAEIAEAAQQDQAGESQDETLWDDDDPGRPFDDNGRRGD